MTKLLLIDGSSLAFRAFYGITDLNRFKTKQGFHTNALFAFHTMLETIMTRENPTHVLVAFDAGKTTFRTEMFAEYKGTRDSMPTELKEQWPYFKIMLDGLGIAHYDLNQYEADDIIGTLAKQGNDQGIEVVVVTGDKDMLQLVDQNIRVDLTKKGNEIDSYSLDKMQNIYGVTPKQFIDVKGLMGDSSDNYPGVTKVGEKTALKLIQQYGSIDGIYANINDMKSSKLKDNLMLDKEMAYLSQKLATIETNAPLTITLNDILYKGKNYESLRDFYQKMEFTLFLNKLEPVTVESDQNDVSVEFVFVDSIETDYFGDSTILYVENLNDNYHVSKPIGVGWITNQKIYVTEWEKAIQSSIFKQWCESNQSKIIYDSKQLYVLLQQYGITLNHVIGDILIQSYLNNSNDSKVTYSDICQMYLSEVIANDELIYGKGAKLAVPDVSIWTDHVAKKVSLLPKLNELLIEKLKASNQLDLYQSIELPLAMVLAKMESEGIVVEKNRLQEMAITLEERLEVLQNDIHQLAGEQFNISSPKQLGEILFDKLGLPTGKKTKTGYSTAVDVLEKLSGYPIVAKILEYRQISKLNSTYVDGLQKYIGTDQKIHTRFVQTLTQTGRLSSTDPNLQNIPIRLAEGRLIRKVFQPSEGNRVLLSADYSQIELRVLAHIANDQHMIEAFKLGEDIHTSTAMRVFGVSEQQVDEQMRRQAKAVNFGIVYGISDFGLSVNLNITRKEAQKFINTYFEKYPNIKLYMENVVTTAKKTGYVETLYHRRRYLNDINASNFNIRSFAERTAMNTPIQGSAADIIKIAMVSLQKRLEIENIDAKILLQVHDELVLDVLEKDIDLVKTIVQETMENCVQLSVPLKVDMAFGKSWYEAK